MPLPVAALRAQVAALATHMSGDDPSVVAFHGDLEWTGGDTVSVGDRGWAVRCCRTPLEVRELLAYRDADAPPLVILTPLSHVELGADVVARFYKRRLFELDRWEPLLRAFGAHRLDARLVAHPWLADALLANLPPEGYGRVPSGTLDAATAWRHAAQVLLGVEAEGIDAAAVLQWTLEASFPARWRAQSADARTAMRRWVASVSGAAGSLVLALVEHGYAMDAVALALALDVLFADGAEGDAIAGAVIRLERYTGGERVERATGRALAAAARNLLGHVADARKTTTWLARADELLQELGAAHEAYRGRWSPLGFAQRVACHATTLDEALEAADASAAAAKASAALVALRAHERARVEPDLVARAEHALRLVRYLRVAESAPEPASFADAVEAYVREHAHADEARVPLYASETHQALGVVLERVAERVRARREQFTRQFARLAAGWFDAPAPHPRLLPIEHVVRDVVAPLAARLPVLLLVVDGMSLPVAHALLASIVTRGWVPVARPEGRDATPVVAALPSVTEVCRTSLFCGRLRIGTAADERQGFASHPNLVAHSKPKWPPRLFHKADLGAGAMLAPEVADAIARPEQRIVGAVVNAVDDHLLKDDMVRPAWSTQYVPIVAALCDAARAAGRALVITADHGHVLDLKRTDRIASGDADRYRPAVGPVAEGEVRVAGPRVLASAPDVVVAASESVRYASRKNGYHGGISPQELVVPLRVLLPDGHPLDGWTEQLDARPPWWDLELAVAAVALPPAPAPAPTGLPLFDQPPAQRAPTVSVAEPTAPEWLARLLASDVLREQRARATRAAIPEERLRALLTALSSRGGRLTVAAFASRLGVPPGRVSSTVAAAAQLLNFDGYQVVYLAGDEVVLDEGLLKGQFQL
jgi:hypothetical protein